MDSQRWIARRESSWQRLEGLIGQAEKQGIRSLNSAQVQQLASLYRSVSADLARAQSRQVSRTVIQDLQGLTTRSYSLIYQGSRQQEWRQFLEFYRYGFPAAVQQSWQYIALSALIFICGGAIGWWYAWQDPGFMDLVLGADFVTQVRETRELWTVSILGQEPIASSGIMINNVAVSLRAIFGGVTMFMADVPLLMPPGTFTIYLLSFNGIMLGCVGVLVAQVNLAYEFWAFVFPHGALELPAIFIAGGAGLLLGRSILLPGRFHRLDALKFYGLQAARLVYGIIPLLIIAGLIEGFFSPQVWIPNGLKYLVGSGLLVALVQYCRQSP